MVVVKRNNLWRLFLFSVLAVGLLGGSAMGQDPVWQVEEEWELVVATPDTGTAGPQVTCTISPHADLCCQYATFDLNHRASPTFNPGGVHLHMWNGDTRLGTLSRHSNVLIATTGEVVTWKVVMSVEAGALTIDIDDGLSTTWGPFGDTIISSVPTTLTNLDEYSPDVSAANSGIGYASNRVTSLKLKKVTYRRVSGAVSEDNTVRVLHSVE
jgi:hypothetical protein